MSMTPLDLSVTTREAFYRALSAINAFGFTLTEADITAGVPVVDNSHPGANTRITLTPVAGSTKAYGPADDFWYYRRSLQEIYTDVGYTGTGLTVTDAAGDWPVGGVAAPALALVNSSFQSTLQASEVSVTEVSRTDTTLVLTFSMLAGNLALYGDLTLTITFS